MNPFVTVVDRDNLSVLEKNVFLSFIQRQAAVQYNSSVFTDLWICPPRNVEVTVPWDYNH